MQTTPQLLTEFIGQTSPSDLKKLFSTIDVDFRITKREVISLIYKEGADFTKHLLTRLCRGLFFRLVDGQVKIVAYPFTKFFNYNEHQDLFPEEFKEMVKQLEEEKTIFAFNKLDGDIIKLYYDENWDFGSNKIPGQVPQQLTKFLETFKIDFEKLDKNCTYIFEFTAPLMHVTFYDKPQLTLIGIKNNDTEQEIDITQLGKEHLEFPVVKFHEFKSIEEIFEFVNSEKSLDHPGAEGVVIYKYNNGNPIRFKVKSEWWLNQKKYSRPSIMYAGLKCSFFDEKTKDSEDYIELGRYHPSIVEQVNSVADDIKEKVKTLMDKITYIKELDKKLRFKEMNKHPFGSVGMMFLEREFTENDVYQQLFKNNKTKKVIEQMLN